MVHLVTVHVGFSEVSWFFHEVMVHSVFLKIPLLHPVVLRSWKWYVLLVFLVPVVMPASVHASRNLPFPFTFCAVASEPRDDSFVLVLFGPYAHHTWLWWASPFVVRLPCQLALGIHLQWITYLQILLGRSDLIALCFSSLLFVWYLIDFHMATVSQTVRQSVRSYSYFVHCVCLPPPTHPLLGAALPWRGINAPVPSKAIRLRAPSSAEICILAQQQARCYSQLSIGSWWGGTSWASILDCWEKIKLRQILPVQSHLSRHIHTAWLHVLEQAVKQSYASGLPGSKLHKLCPAAWPFALAYPWPALIPQ